MGTILNNVIAQVSVGNTERSVCYFPRNTLSSLHGICCFWPITQNFIDASSQRWLLDRLLVTLFVSTCYLAWQGGAVHFIGQFKESWIYTRAFRIITIEECDRSLAL